MARDLPLYEGKSEFLIPSSFCATASPVRFDEGFHPEEHEGPQAFRWMSQKGRLGFTPRPEKRFLEIDVFSEFGDLSQTLSVSSGKFHETLELVRGWAPITVQVPAEASSLTLEVSKLFPLAYHGSDHRHLAIRVARPLLHTDPLRHSSIRRQWANAVLNTREMLEGRTILSSTPPGLGLDLHGACNVKPPCVYCEWDESKEKEGGNVDIPFTAETLSEYGEFFANASQLFNCAIGEPFMMRNLDELLDIFGEQGKALEMSTNGQLLTDRNIEKLLGRRIELYISLDAATPQTYSRLRNNTFDRILRNIRRLVQAREGRDGLPKIYLVFMPMRANAHELDAFVELCADLGVDKLILRPLNATMGPDLDWERGGYHFRYSRELLSLEELARIAGRTAELASRRGVALVNQLDFGGALESDFQKEYSQGRREAAIPTPAAEPALPLPTPGAAVPANAGPRGPMPSLGLERWPSCTEPWRNFYILRRGVLPCSYGCNSIAAMDGYRESWNSPLMQEIRAHLSRGSFHRYCLKSTACPIVRKSSHLHRIPHGQRALLWGWRFWHGLNSVTAGVPRWLLRRMAGRSHGRPSSPK